MNVARVKPRPAPISAPVRRIMRKHGLSEPSARAIAALAYRDDASYGW